MYFLWLYKDSFELREACVEGLSMPPACKVRLAPVESLGLGAENRSFLILDAVVIEGYMRICP